MKRRKKKSCEGEKNYKRKGKIKPLSATDYYKEEEKRVMKRREKISCEGKKRITRSQKYRHNKV